MHRTIFLICIALLAILTSGRAELSLAQVKDNNSIVQNIANERIANVSYTITADENGQTTIEVTGVGATVSLADIQTGLGNANLDLLQDAGGGIWQLNANLFIGPGVTLNLSPATNTSELRLRSQSSAVNQIDYATFVYLRTYDGTINLDSVKIYSWDATTNTFDTDYSNGRAYLLAKYNAVLNIYNAELSYLGSANAESYGVTWRDINDPTNPTQLRTRVTGQVLNSLFHHNYFGISTFQANSMFFQSNVFHSNALYGLNFSDFSHHITSENNLVYNNGAHGLIISHNCNNFIIRNNDIYGNSDYGIYLTDGANQIMLQHNSIYTNVGYGIGANGSQTMGNTWSQNLIYANQAGGINLISGANLGVSVPTLLSVAEKIVTGNTNPGATVEIFADTMGQGQYFEGQAVAAQDGHFSLTITGNWQASNLTAITIDSTGNASAFSAPIFLEPSICYDLITSVNPSGGGALTSSPLPNCEGNKYQQGTVVSLSAAANSGYAFSHWSGAISSNSNPVTITLNEDKNVSAHFNQFVSFSVIVPGTSVGTNTGYVISVGDQINFTATGSVNAWPPMGSTHLGGPDGNQYWCDANCLLAPARFAALIGRIGDDGEWFLIGSQTKVIAERSGPLILAVNDSIPSGNVDNTGEFTVAIAVNPSLNSAEFQEDFSTDPYTTGQWQIFRQANDSGVWDANSDLFYLTRDVRWQSSIMFANYTISSHAWDASFRFKAGGQSNGVCGDQGGDGITFFFYANTTTPGSGRIYPPTQGYSIKLDSYTGRSCDVTPGELINYIAVMKGNTILTTVQDNRVEDNQWHTINISFNNGTIVVGMDGSSVINYQIENPDYTLSNMGFHAMTGNASNDQIIDDFAFITSSTPPDTEPPPIPWGRVLTCFYDSTSGSSRYYRVKYKWNAVNDIGTSGMHQHPYWSQISEYSDFHTVPQPGWYNSWDNVTERDSEIPFIENTTLYAHVRSRDAYDNQSSWSETSQLILNANTCTGEIIDIFYELPNFGESGKPFNQTNLNWSEKPYGWDSNTDNTPEYTIGNYGCNMTVGAMIANYYARLQGKSFHTDPDDLNTWLRKNEGYNEALTKHNRISDYARDSSVQYGVDSELEFGIVDYLDNNNYVDASDADANAFVAKTKQAIDTAIRANKPVMVAVKSSSGTGHFVVLTGIARVNNVDTWLVHDPLRDQATTLQQAYHNRYYNTRVFKSLVVTSSLNIMIPVTENAFHTSVKTTDAINSVEFILIDPLGRRTGVLPNQQKVQEIPEAIYGLDSLTPINGGTGYQWIALTVVNPIEGTYALTITGSGTYRLAVDSTDVTGLYSKAETAVTLTPGSNISYAVSYTSGAPIVVTPAHFIHAVYLPLITQ